MLNEQGVFARYLMAACNVRYFYQQCCAATVDWRHTTVNCALVRVHFTRSEPHFVCIVIARFDDSTQDVAQLRFIINQA
jgi:hypothetical protein